MEGVMEYARSNRALYGLFALILVYVGRIQELYPVLEKLSLGKIAIGLTAILFLTSPADTRKAEVGNLPQVKRVTQLLFMAVASIPFSVWPGHSLTSLTDFLKTILFFYFLVKTLSFARDTNLVIWSVVLSVFFLSVSTIAVRHEMERASASSSYDPNDLAFIIVCLLPLVYFFMKQHTGMQRMFLLLTIGLMIVAAISTKSRSGFIGLNVIFLLTMIRERMSPKQIILTSAMIITVGLIFTPSSFWERMTTITDLGSDYNVQSSGGRVEIWKRGMGIIAKSPLLGVGIGGFETAEGLSHGGGGKWSSSHNSFIQIGAELGVPGLILFCLLLGTSIKCLRRIASYHSPPPTLWLINGTEVGLYGYIVSGFFLSQAYSAVLFLLVGLSVFCTRQAIEDGILNVKGEVVQPELKRVW